LSWSGEKGIRSAFVLRFSIRDLAMSSGHDLNSLSRFRKQSRRLVLEEHSHCEVPAGCGGVVLRWRDPLALVPLTLYLYTPVSAVCLLDGEELRSTRVDLPPGKHVVTLALENLNLSAGVILFAAVHAGTPAEAKPQALVIEAPVKVVSADDGTWRGTVNQPVSDDWKSLAFADQDWHVLTRAKVPKLDAHTTGKYQHDECVRQGAIGLGLPAPGGKQERAKWWQRLLGLQAVAASRSAVIGNIWIRKVFEVPQPQWRKS
jgi:hypothetical protein